MKYIFLDNWVYSKLADDTFARKLTRFVHAMDYTVMLTSLSFVELYNPSWQDSSQRDRVLAAADFLSHMPCVLVRQEEVFRAEIEAELTPLEALPIELDLQQLPHTVRAQSLVFFLRRDERYLRQGKNIDLWSKAYSTLKANWLANVEDIIEQACVDGVLQRDGTGRFVELGEHKEHFLFSLDFRHADPSDVDRILRKLLQRKQMRQPTCLTAVRMTSLCFWYSYVYVDNANRMKRNGSDIGDFYQISLLPYCAAFTVDRTMEGMLRRIQEPVVPVRCELFTETTLADQIEQYL